MGSSYEYLPLSVFLVDTGNVEDIKKEPLSVLHQQRGVRLHVLQLEVGT